MWVKEGKKKAKEGWNGIGMGQEMEENTENIGTCNGKREETKKDLENEQK